MHQICLHISFDPAGALSDPIADMAVGLLQCRGINDGCFVAFFKKPDSQITILGHIERIPAFQFKKIGRAEMIAGAAQRNGGIDRLKAGQNNIKPQRILGRKKTSQKILLGIVVIQFCLQAFNIRGRRFESEIRLFKLFRLRNILGVVNHDKFAFGK